MKNGLLLTAVLALVAGPMNIFAANLGTLTANGQKVELQYVTAYETESSTEQGYLDVVVVIADRQIPEAVARDQEKLEALARSKGFAGLRLVLNPDSKVISAEPLHAAFTNQISSALWVRWEPTAFDVKQVAGHLYTEGLQDEFGQQWQYDITFSASILLDPAAGTVPQ